jgi:hypothetical protein
VPGLAAQARMRPRPFRPHATRGGPSCAARSWRGNGRATAPTPVIFRTAARPLHRASRAPPPPLRCAPRVRPSALVLAARFSFAPEFCRYQANKQRPRPIFVRQRRWWNRPVTIRCGKAMVSSLRGAKRRSNPDSVPPTLDCFVASLLAMTKRKAERRQTLFINLRISRCGTAPTLTLPRARGRAWEGAARLSAFHHGTCGSDRTPPLSFSHATSGDLVGAHVPMVRKTRTSQRLARIRPADASPRALPAPSCPRPARLHPRSGHDAVRACPAEAAREHG